VTNSGLWNGALGLWAGFEGFADSSIPPPILDWILATGFWNDAGGWDDTANWID
jgi:hypothetical protein